MKTTTLGDTDLTVSTLCLGTMYFGTTVDEPTSFSLLDQYVEAGGTFLDTANCYAFWAPGGSGDESEALLGRWLRSRGNRDALTVATKVGCRPNYPGAPFPEEAQGLRRGVIVKDVEESLKRLGIDTIDLYYTHQDDRHTPLEETLAALDELVRAGKVRHIACSNMRAWRVAQAHGLSRANGWASYVAVQQRHSYLKPKPGSDFGVQLPVNTDLLDFARSNPDVALLAYSPLLGGTYTRADRPLDEAYRSADNEERLRVLNQVAAETGATPNQVVLAWMLQGSPTVMPIIAASTTQQLEENLAAVGVTLSPQHLERLAAPAGDL